MRLPPHSKIAKMCKDKRRKLQKRDGSVGELNLSLYNYRVTNGRRSTLPDEKYETGDKSYRLILCQLDNICSLQ